MDAPEPTVNAADAAGRSGRSLGADAARRLSRDKAAVACFAIILVYAAIAIIAPFAYSGWKDNLDYANAVQPPSLKHWLGTDKFGRDVLQETLLGAQVSMTVGVMSNIIAVPLGMILGALAGYFGRWIDDLVVWLYTTLSSIPGIVALIAIKFAFYGKVLFAGTFLQMDLSGLAGIYIALGILSWIGTCRYVRAEVMKLRELDYVVAARAIGRGDLAILARHIMPNVLHIGIIMFSLGFVGAVMAEVILSYLGLGVGAGVSSWGSMINAARMDLVVGRWWELTAAVTAMFILVLALNIFGDRLRDALDPRLRNV
ncbi:MAG: ABC transporter permease [Phycisphaerae bacterium]